MKSPHLLSSVHDLAICTRSAQTSHKEEDFITTSRTVAQYSAEFSHRMDRATVQRILADLISAIPQFRITRNKVSRRVQIWLELIFHWMQSRSILIGLPLPTSVICPMGFTNGLPDNTIRITMTIPTQIQNQPLVSHILLTHELQPIEGGRGVISKSYVICFKTNLCSQVCLVVLSRLGSNLNHAFCAQLPNRASK